MPPTITSFPNYPMHFSFWFSTISRICPSLLSPSLRPTLVAQVGCQSWMATCNLQIALMSSHRGLKPKSSSVLYTPSCSLSWCLRSGLRLSSVCKANVHACIETHIHPPMHMYNQARHHTQKTPHKISDANPRTGIIVDSFKALREEREETEKDIKYKCFICGINRDVFDSRLITSTGGKTGNAILSCTYVVRLHRACSALQLLESILLNLMLRAQGSTNTRRTTTICGYTCIFSSTSARLRTRRSSTASKVTYGNCQKPTM